MKGWHTCEAHNVTYTCPKCRKDPVRDAMVRVCEAAQDCVDAQVRYGFEQQAWVLLTKLLADLERARKGEG